MSIDDLLSRLNRVHKTRDAWTAQCPAHADRNPSLSIAERDGKILLHCHVGCLVQEIVKALGLRMSDLSVNSTGRRNSRGGKSKRTSERGGGGPCNASSKDATPQHPIGLTLEQYAVTKNLSVDFLCGLGLSTIHVGSQPAVRIPYRGLDGLEAAVRFRLALEGEDRFRWRTGSKPCLYGLWRLRGVAEFICLVEGESDSHTLWYHNIPALGLPGASLWREEWAKLLEGIRCIYVVDERDKGGEAVRKWLSRSRIRERVKVMRLDGVKDASALYLKNPSGFVRAWHEAMASAVAWSELERVEAESRSSDAFQKCKELANCDDILDRVSSTMCRLGVVGEKRAVKLIYLAVTSRLLPRPTSVVVKGPSSGGKSYIVERTLQLFPASSYYELSAMSERALAYSEEPLSHRVLVLYEAAGLSGDFASYLVRSLLSEGRLRYETVEKTSQGLRPRLIEREGPTGLIVTTTQLRLHPENETRLFAITVDDSRDQTKAVLSALADETGQADGPSFLEPWHALQDWLASTGDSVTIPYAKKLAELLPPVAVRLRRDFGSILNLIRAHARLHRATRNVDQSGRIIATFADYTAVRDLVGDLVSEGLQLTVSKTVRETVEAVSELCDQTSQPVSVSQLARQLKLDPATASRRVRVAINRGYLQNLEEKRGKPFKLIIGDPMPIDTKLLPDPEALGYCRVAHDSEGIKQPPSSDKETSDAGTGEADKHPNLASKSEANRISFCEGEV